MNIAKLKGKMAEKGMTSGKLAKILGYSQNTISAKMTGKSKWNLEDVIVTCAALSLTDDEKCSIFLN